MQYKSSIFLNFSIELLFNEAYTITILMKEENSLNSTTSNRIKQAMKSSNLKQIDIVNKAKSMEEETGIKLSKTDLSQYVNGKVTPGQKKLYVLAKILNVSEAWLLGYDVESKRIDDKERDKFNQQQETIAGHANKDEFTPEEWEEIENFMQWVRDRKK